MKKRMSLLAALLLVLVFSCAAAQQNTLVDWNSVPREQTSHFTFKRATRWENYQEEEIDEIYITGYTGNAQVLRIPDTIAGMPVTGMTDEILHGNTTLTHLYLPDTLTDMFWNSLSGCTNLVQVHLPAQMTHLPANLFAGCTSLRSVEMPQGLVEIGYHAFEGCTALENIDIPASVQCINGSAFAETAIAQIDLSHVGVLQGGEIFRDCKNLTSVKLSDTLYHFNELDSDVFVGCDKLANLEIVPGLCTVTAEIADEFIEGYELEDMNLGHMSVQSGMLFWNDMLVLILPGTVGETLTIPEGVTHLPSYAFRGMQQLRSVTLPDSMTEIANGAFADCTNLTSVTFGAHTEAIGGEAFMNTGLTSLTLPQSLRIIYGSAFEGCASLTQVDLPQTLEEIRDCAFMKTGLVSVQMPESLRRIGDGAFGLCEKLETVTLSSGRNLEKVGFPFQGDRWIKNLILPDDADFDAWKLNGQMTNSHQLTATYRGRTFDLSSADDFGTPREMYDLQMYMKEFEP
ncbi:MAG: leucine-rich repeat domain-containing protein [Clostridia bacterium]|nr:leucine-rich repeat domain-containing protein [Clostridia bacterium]